MSPPGNLFRHEFKRVFTWVAYRERRGVIVFRQGSNHGQSLRGLKVHQDHQWQANLRILDVKEIKTVTYVP